MKSILMRIVRSSILGVFIFLSSNSQIITSAPQPTQKKIDPLLQQAIFTKRVSPDRAVAGVEYYSADKSPIEGVGDVIGILIRSNEDVQSFVRSLGGVVGSRHGNIYTALVPMSKVTALAENPRVQYLEASRRLFASLDLSLAKTRADVLHQITNPALKLTGKGIIIGFTDSGINTLHPNFKREDGKTRILYIWDQQVSGGGMPPAGFTYGVEKDSSAINNGMYTMYDNDYHGTHVSGIAAGNGLPTKKYVGMAPEADIIMVSNIGDDLFDRGMTTVGTLDGYDYIRTKANILGKRHVINTSEGTNLGPHDGTTLFEQALNADAAAGSIFCLSAGNEATSRRHASAVVTTGSSKEIECYIGLTGYTIPMDIWYESGDRLQLQIKKSTDVAYTMTVPAIDTTVTFTFDAVTVTVTSNIGSPLNGDNELYITFYPFSSVNMKLKFSAVPGNTLPNGGRVDLWWERNYPVEFVTNVDQSITFGIPAGADSAITVASYNNRTNYGSADDISTFSGRGPRRDGKIKPDIAGIGGDVISSVSSGSYTSFSGTSMSSPHAAGAVALLLQQDTSLTGYQIKEKLKASAITDGFTGAVPNGTWGFGKLNVLKAAGYKGFTLTSFTPDSMLFGSVFVNTQKNLLLNIKNLGYEDVQITNITASNPRVTVNKTSFTVPARSDENLTVSALPTDTGSFNGTIEITSSDASSPSVILPVFGRGDFQPEVAITPDSLSFVVNEGDSTDLPVTISNSGQGPLTYKVEVDYQVQSSGLQMNVQKTLPQPWGSNFRVSTTQTSSAIVPNLPLLPLVLKDPIDDASGVDIAELRGEKKQDSLYIQIVTATFLSLYNFNGYLGLDIDQNTATGRKLPYGLTSHDVGCDFILEISGLSYSSIYLYDSSGYYVGSYAALVDTAGKRFTIALPLNKLKNDDGIVNLAGVFGSGSFSTDYVPNAGHGTIGQQWLVVNPKEGSVAPSGSQPITVRVRTKDLDGGSFKANVVVATNDPDEETKTIPVSLTVIGNPNLVAIDSIKYPLVYLGFPDTVGVTLGNNGTDNLAISGITASDPQLTILGSTSITIPKNQTRTIKVVFSPSATGNFSGSLTIASNDPGSPSLPIAVVATVVHPPVIGVSPASFSLTLSENDSTVEQFTISNSGLGTLHWKDRSIAKSDTDFYSLFFGGNSLWKLYDPNEQAVAYQNGSQQYKQQGLSTHPGISASISSVVTDFPLYGATSTGVHQIDPLTGSIKKTFSFSLSGGPDGLAFDGSYLYLLVGYSNQILKLQAESGAVVDTIFYSGPSSVDGLATDGTLLYILNYSTYQIFSLDPETGVIVATLTPGFAIGGGITFAGKRSSFFVSNFESGIYELNPKTGAVLRNFPSPNGISIIGVAYSNAADLLVVSGSGQTFFMNPNSGEIVGSFSAGFSALTADEAGMQFLASSPASGTIGPGASQNVTLKISAKNLPPGTHVKTISLVNNDPAHNPKNIPVTLQVKGRPTIVVEPDTLSYAVSFVGILHRDTLRIKNAGSEQLKIFDITSTDTMFHFNKNVFNVAPHTTELVSVSFTPQVVGSFSSLFTITSNDSGKLTVQIPVTGHAEHPPVITTAPDSLIVSVDEGDSTVQALTIGNTGLGTLHWEVPLPMRSPSAGLSANAKKGGALIPRTGQERAAVMLQQKNNAGSNKGDGTVSQYSVSSLLSSTGTLRVLLWTRYGDKNFGAEIENTMNAIEMFRSDVQFDTSQTMSPTEFASRLNDADVFIMPEQELNFDLSTLGTAFSSALKSFVESGKTAIAMDHGGGGATSFINATGLIEISNVVSSGSFTALVHDTESPIVKDVTSPFIAMDGSNYHYSSNGRKIVREQNSGNNMVTVREIGAGTVIYIGMDFYSYNNDMARLLANAVGTTSGRRFFSVNPGFGDIAPSATTEVSVKLQAQSLRGGKDYQSTLIIINNDPIRNPKNVPVRLRVVGKPIVDLHPDSLINLLLYVGVPHNDTLHVQNKGTEVLSISNISTTDSSVKVNKTSFNVAAGKEEKVLVTITAGDTGTFSRKITLTTNDTKKPSVDFAVKGTATYPPIFATSADTLTFAVEQHDSATQKVTFSNRGKSALQWAAARISPRVTGRIGSAIEPPLTNSIGTLRILVWNAFGDTVPDGSYNNFKNAIKQFRPDAQFDSSTTTSPVQLTSQLGQADVLIVPAQYYAWDLSTQGSLLASAISAFVQNGHTMIVLDGTSSGSTIFLNATGLMNISVISGWNSFNAQVYDHSSPLVDSVANTFSCYYNSNYHTSTNGNKIISEQNTGNNVVTSRSVGTGFVVYLGMDYYSYNSSMAKILSNAVGLTAKNNILSVIPEQGTIPAGGSQEVTVKCLAKEMTEGLYKYKVEFSSNDPVTSTRNIFVNVTVQPPHRELYYLLKKGLNLISWNITRTGLDSTREVFSPVMSSLSSVIGYYGEEKTFDPGHPFSSTLKTVDNRHGYWVTMNTDAIFSLEGRQLNSQTPLLVTPGYNLVSYLGQSNDTVRSAFRTILNNVEWIMSYSTEPLTFDPKVPSEFNTLKVIKPGSGYWLKMKTLDTLVYPASGVAITKTSLAKDETAAASPLHSREWINLWGKEIKISNQLVTSGTVITAVDEEGTVCGQSTFFANGKFGMMPVFRDDSTTLVDEGVKKDGWITFTIGKNPISRKLQWKNFGDVVDFNAFLTDVAEGTLIPNVFALHQNFPNPFNPTTTIKYDIPKTTHVSLDIYNILGKRVMTLVNEEQSPGYYSLTWNAQTREGSVASGVYFARIRAGEFVKTMKMLLIK